MTKTCTFELQINFETNQARDGCLSTIMILSCPEDILYALMCIYICRIMLTILLFAKFWKRWGMVMKKVFVTCRCRSIDQDVGMYNMISAHISSL